MSVPREGQSLHEELSGDTMEGSAVQDTVDWRSEFEKRRHAFEREPTNIKLLDSPGMVFSPPPTKDSSSRLDNEPTSVSGSGNNALNEELPDGVATDDHLQQESAPLDPHILPLLMRRSHLSTDTSSRNSIDGQRLPLFPDQDSETSHPLRETSSHNDTPLLLQTPPILRRPRPPSQTPGDLAIGEETGQKEHVFTEGRLERAPLINSQRSVSPTHGLMSQSDDSEREDSALSKQIAMLTMQNVQLQKQLRDREVERDRLCQQLEQKEKNIRAIYSPPGLPSRVLDGRKVLRDSLPFSFTPPLLSPSSMLPSSHPFTPSTPRPLTPSVARPTTPTMTRPLTPYSPLQLERPTSPQLDSHPFNPLLPSSGFGDGDSTEVKGELQQLKTLRQNNRKLEQRLVEVMEEKRRVENELARHKETLVKIQEREKDLSQDIKTLRTENSHQTGTISKLRSERDSLKSSNTILNTKLTALSDKLTKTEKCYKEVEQENLSLEADIEQLVQEKEQLYHERENLQSSVEDALKTKESYRLTIRDLRDQNVTLETQLSGEAVKKTDKVKVQTSVPVSKGQQVLNEVLSLRGEKTHLKVKLINAQQEIDSLEAHLKVQETQEDGVTKFRTALTAHLVGFQNHVSSISHEIEATKNTVSTLATEQKAILHDRFLLLASKCREQLTLSAKDKGQMAEILSKTERSLAALQEDFDRLRSENSKLVSQKQSVSCDVRELHSEIQSLTDQRKMLKVQLSQYETLSAEKDDHIKRLQEKSHDLEGKYKTSEKNWKNEFGRLEREWEGRVAEATQAHELLLDEKESLEVQKNELEEQLLEVRQENHQLCLVRAEFQKKVVTAEEQLDLLSGKFTEKEILIYKAEQELAKLLSEKTLISAIVQLEQESFRTHLSIIQSDKDSEVEAANARAEELAKTLNELQSERSSVDEKMSEVAEKESQISSLSAKVLSLVTEKKQLEEEMKLLKDEHKSAVRDFQSLMATEHRRQLENEKLKMTLTTEIELLKMKLKSVEEGKETEATKDKTTMSAFQVVPQGKHVEQLRKQIFALQEESKLQRFANNYDSNSSRLALAELQTRLTAIETENSKLKDGVRDSQESTELQNSLRKQVSQLSRKNFFVESEKKHLMEKLHAVQAREVKDRLVADRMQEVQDDNQILQERLGNLEGGLTKKMMAADLKIVQTIKENDRLRQKLVRIHSTLDSGKKKHLTLKELLPSLKRQTNLIADVPSPPGADLETPPIEPSSQSQPSSRRSSTSSLKQVDVSSGRSVTFVRSISTSSGASSPVTTLPTLPTLPSLPSFQNQKNRASGNWSGASSPVPMATAAPNQLKDKVDQLTEKNEHLSRALQKHKELLRSYEVKVSAVSAEFTSLVSSLEDSLALNFDLYETVSSLSEYELKVDDLKMVAVLQQQVESLQDQVIDRDMALQDIELQMKKDYNLHDKKFASKKSLVIELREQISTKDNHLRTKDLYIQQLEEKQLELDSQLYHLHKELDREKREVMTHTPPENLQHKFSGTQPILKIPDVIRVQGEEIHRLQKVVSDFTFDLSQLQSQLDTSQREKGMLQSKTLELERMHIQMKEAMTADINYLRTLNLQLVGQQIKAEKATEILKDVREAQETFRKQKDIMKMEAELDASKLEINDQSRRVYDLERQLAYQNITVKLLQAEKDHAFLLTQHAKDLTSHLRPRSAEARSAEVRKANYRISDSKPRFITLGRYPLPVGEFSIPFPITNSSQGVDILNLEEQPEHHQAHIPLGPTVVTDDEYSTLVDQDENSNNQPRLQKSRVRGHRRTVSTGSNIFPSLSQDSEETSANDVYSSVLHHHTLPLADNQKGVGLKYPRRPGSADSTRRDVRDLSQMPSPEHVSKTAREVSTYMSILIDDASCDKKVGVVKKGKTDPIHSPIRSRTTSLGQASLRPKYTFTDVPRKQTNKSTDSTETTSSSSDGKSLSSQFDAAPSSAVPVPTNLSAMTSSSRERPPAVNPTAPTASVMKHASAIVDRTESMSSSCSTLSIYQPSRVPSFSMYDGGESSQTSLEIGDSVENLQAPSKVEYDSYMLSVHYPKLDMNSSSDDDFVPDKRVLVGRRKWSSGNGNEGPHDTPRHKDISDHSNSSCDSDQLQQGSYKATNIKCNDVIPVHRNDSISISDMEKYLTDAEGVERKAADIEQLRHRFGRERVSSTGSMKICYSESSNTSLEDISRNM